MCRPHFIVLTALEELCEKEVRATDYLLNVDHLIDAEWDEQGSRITVRGLYAGQDDGEGDNAEVLVAESPIEIAKRIWDSTR